MKIRIGYSVYTVSAMSDETQAREDAWGFIDPAARSIEVYPHVPADEQGRILLHEIMHGVFDLFRGFTNGKKLSEEDVCGMLDSGLSTVFVQNPELLGVLHQAWTNGKAIV